MASGLPSGCNVLYDRHDSADDFISRAMAEETVDVAVKEFNLKPNGPSQTNHIKLVGGHAWSKTMYIKLIQQFGLETEVANHLSESYGDRAWTVASMAKPTGMSTVYEGIVFQSTNTSQNQVNHGPSMVFVFQNFTRTLRPSADMPVDVNTHKRLLTLLPAERDYPSSTSKLRSRPFLEFWRLWARSLVGT